MTLMVPGWKVKKCSETNRNDHLAGLIGNPKDVSGALMGTPAEDVFVRVQTEAPKFAQAANAILSSVKHNEMEVGYVNLGNTCFLGAILAMLENSADFRQTIIHGSDLSGMERLLQVLWLRKSRFSTGDPTAVLQECGRANPVLTQRASDGMGFQQQDADEALSALMNHLTRGSMDIFRIWLSKRLQRGEEAPTEGKESEFKLHCYLGTSAKPVSNIYQGLELALNEDIVSEESGIVTKKSLKLTKILPKFLIIHMVRFEWKRANDLARTRACKAKILKRIDYPDVLDMFNFCDDELKDILSIGRNPEENETDQQTFGDDRISDGTYELKSVITHKGRSIDEGHYICWNWHPKEKEWIKLDDNKSSAIAASNIDLRGGLADGHVPYILMYELRGQLLVSNEDEEVDEDI